MLKVLVLLLAVFLVIGQSCEVSDSEDIDDTSQPSNVGEETENPEDEFYDNLDGALSELDELENQL